MVLFAISIGGFAVIITLNNIAGPEKQAKTLSEGDCVVLTGAGEEADAVPTPCDSPQASYAVSLTGVTRATGTARTVSTTPPPLKDCGSARLKISEVFPEASVANSPCAEGTAEVVSYAGYATSKFKSATICFVTP
ncbi:hypothetical protein LCL61_39485 [Amycolatopsis coloradensis]|uniref:Uncharacterized protein n=1 Tax=Amycolatopsis coloradensis TaxID=76021 RepID=A0ACD5BW17_9PSEU